METLKYKTKIEGQGLPVPEHLLSKLRKMEEVEVIFRPIRESSLSDIDVEQAINGTVAQAEKEFPNLKRFINNKLRAVAGTSSENRKKYKKYTDKEIITMGKMEKHLEKEEIIENLF